ncbi:MAG: zinc ribbon domain-containing protein [Oscillospiraceae bacterium]|nr:zinc ribbon domain-containing protein [Oscillospiraceae bacterium]
MSKYTGWKCPVCDNTFDADSDVSVCPDCGAPHHRGCYKKTGRCFYEDAHGSKDQYIPPEMFSGQEGSADENDVNSDEPFIRCPNCKNPSDADSIFCKICGLPVRSFHAGQTDNAHKGYTGNPAGGQGAHTEQEVYKKCVKCGHINNSSMVYCQNCAHLTDGEIEGVPIAEMETYIGENNAYYIGNFARIKKRRPSFNIAAGLLKSFYFVYRKMYGWAILFFVVNLVLSSPSILSYIHYYIYEYYSVEIFSESFISLLQTLMSPASFVSIAFTLLTGFLGNRLYLRKSVRDINLIKSGSFGKQIAYPQKPQYMQSEKSRVYESDKFQEKDKEYRAAEIKKELAARGGVSKLAVVLFASAHFAVAYIVMLALIGFISK